MNCDMRVLQICFLVNFCTYINIFMTLRIRSEVNSAIHDLQVLGKPGTHPLSCRSNDHSGLKTLA